MYVEIINLSGNDVTKVLDDSILSLYMDDEQIKIYRLLETFKSTMYLHCRLSIGIAIIKTICTNLLRLDIFDNEQKRVSENETLLYTFYNNKK